MPKLLPERPVRAPGHPVTFVFVGSVCVRKGAHLLLEAWRRPPPGAHLRLVGVEPAIRARFADVLDSGTVSAVGFSRDVAGELPRADVAVLPSLEEGDPIATYAAASPALPVIASAVLVLHENRQQKHTHPTLSSDAGLPRAAIVQQLIADLHL